MEKQKRYVYIVFGLLTPFVLFPACSESTRYRMLTFFFDGVPPPGQKTKPSEDAAPAQEESQDAVATPVRKIATIEVYSHPPYRNNKCGSCHDLNSGQMFKTVQNGLCQMCHKNIPGEARYVHGPVALNECLFCHHHHNSRYPKLLTIPRERLCFECHEQEDLTEGVHHESLEQKTCVECHNPHSGSDRYFLNRMKP